MRLLKAEHDGAEDKLYGKERGWWLPSGHLATPEKRREAFIQGYNAQAAVDAESHVIVEVSTSG